MKLVDVHSHLNHKDFERDLDQVIKRAQKVGLQAIVVSGVNPASNREVLALAERYPILKSCLGIYPIDALGLAGSEIGLPRQAGPINLEEEFKFMEKNKDKIIGVGEVGADFHWAKKEETYDKQAENFRKIIRFAIKIKKPVVIHSRKAEEECIDILEQEIKHNEIPVIQHCFSGRKSLIRKAAALGHYFSVPPNLLKSSNFQTLVKVVNLKQLLTETDAPWLSPTNQRNEPAFVLETVKKIAEIKQLPIEEVAAQIWKNYQQIFE